MPWDDFELKEESDPSIFNVKKFIVTNYKNKKAEMMDFFIGVSIKEVKVKL